MPEQEAVEKKVRTARKPKAKNEFEPYAGTASGREVADPEVQEDFYQWYKGLTKVEKAVIGTLVKKITTGIYLTNGYRKVVRFLALFIKDQGDIKF